MKHRRLVNIHTTGPYAGIAHIHGIEPTERPLFDHELPKALEVSMLDGRLRVCEMAWANERAVFYREAV